jgi:hypothetical protein
MAPRASDPAPPRALPWYLVAALVGAFVLGTGNAMDGCIGIDFYSNATPEPAVRLDWFSTSQGREAVVASNERYFRARDDAKKREFPLSIGHLLLGLAVSLAAVRGMTGQLSSRSPLVQLTLAQGALAWVAFVLTPDLRAAEHDLRRDVILEMQRDAAATDPQAAAELRDDAWTRLAMGTLRLWPVGRLALHTVGSVLIVIALSRRGSREFFPAEAAGAK